jgi:hypothetical protein
MGEALLLLSIGALAGAAEAAATEEAGIGELPVGFFITTGESL